MSIAISLRRNQPRAPVLSEIRTEISKKRRSYKPRMTEAEKEALNEGFEEYEKNGNKWLMEELAPHEAFLVLDLPRKATKVSLHIYEVFLITYS